MEDSFNFVSNVQEVGVDGFYDTSITIFENIQKSYGLSDSWINDAQKYFELSDEDIIQSVEEASKFFGMENPMVIQDYKETCVKTGLPFTETDDILGVNRQQLQYMGLTDKDSFDLVMTHECTHIMVQAISDSLSSNQEELCRIHSP